MTVVVFWDIDGTLLTTGRAGIYAWEEALAATTGRTVDLAAFDTAGLPDFAIAQRLLQTYGTDAGETTVRRLVEGYEARLPASLPRRQGRVLPGVREILERLASTPTVCSMLLTGNTRRGAAAKLSHYELAHFFRDGAFSDDAWERPGIAKRAWELAGERGHAPAPASTFVVGDTPHDITCGQAIGVRTIAVATGQYSREALAAYEPWRVLDQLPAPDVFLQIVSDEASE